MEVSHLLTRIELHRGPCILTTNLRQHLDSAFLRRFHAVIEFRRPDARARAESLERDAQERHRQAMGSLVQQREELERRVDDLRAFEREYRSRLKAYLEGQLRDLEAGAADSGTFPAVAGPQSSVGGGMPSRMESRNGQPAVTGAYVGSPEPGGHNGGFHA